MTTDADIVIAGGGLNGPALALALARAGLGVALVDPRPARARGEAGFDGRAYALAAASRRLLGALGVWDALAPQAQPIRRIKASDGRAGTGAAQFFLQFDSAEIEEGPMGFMVEDRHLHAALRDAVEAEPGIATHRAAATAQAVEGGRIAVGLSTGDRLAARLLVGCDGRESGTAARAGIARVGWSYGQTALVAAVRHEADHQGTAHQYFMPEGPLAILPLAGGHHSSVVWAETDANARAIAALPDGPFLAALAPRFGRFLGPIALAGDRFSYPLSLSLARDWVAPRLALAGDAAHGIHPIAGQGLNLGLRDVAALAQVVVEAARRGEDIGAVDVLGRYQAWRRFDTTVLALGMDAVNRLFSNDNPAVRLARDLGMGLIGRMPPLRRAFIRQAAGLTGDLPRLLAGQPL